MTKYKVCPYCGKRNLPKMLECIQCETDLSNIRVMDEEIENKKKKIQEKESSIQMIRLCDCGCKNVVNARKCVNCGEDISDVVPSEEDEEAQITNNCVLVSIDGKYAFEIDKQIICVGRDSGMSDYLKAKLYVSRQHAELIRKNDKFYIRNISQTNYTYVNNVKITQEIYELHDGDEIGLGGNCVKGNRQQDAAYFQVRINTCM